MTAALLPDGSYIGRYRIDSRLGRGGMGEVYKAYDPSLQRHVALKILPAELVQRRDRLERFIQEARSASALSHPHIVTIYEIGEVDSLHYIAMELIEGSTLRQEIHLKRTPVKRLLELLIQVAGGLAKAHAGGIVHRDLKPDNIMVTADGYAKIVDFGLAKLFEFRSGKASDFSTAVRTREGAALGTVGYMSPEQIEGRPTDHRCDIFSFGCVLHEALTRLRPFEGASDVDTLHKILHDDPPPMQGISPDARRIVDRCLAKNPEDRYQSIKDVAADLQQVIQTVSSPPRRWGRLSALLGTATLAVIAAVFVARRETKPEAVGAPRIQSLAVLPLANLSGDPAQEYFVDGMHEALIADMAQIRALRVISRTSVMQYKRNPKPLPEIARELNVDAVIEGSVARAGDRVRITAQLLDARADRHLWAKSYERSMRDILTLQSEVANAIVSEIRVTLTTGERARLTDSRPVNPAAYEAFLKGQYFLRLGNGDAKSIQQFNQAIALDPAYAAAWAYLGMSYNQTTLFGHMAPREAATRAKPAILKALELDPDQADAHMALATLLLRYEFDWVGAEREYRRAIELNPGNEYAHRAFSWFLTAAARYDEALAEGQRTYELDPLRGDRNLGWLHLRAGRLDDSIKYYRRALELDPNAHWGRANMAMAYAFKGQPLVGAAECDKIPVTNRDTPISGVCAWVFAAAGRAQEARHIIEEFEQPGRGYVDPLFVAVAHAALREKEQVLTWLEKAYETRSPNLWGIGTDTNRRYFDLVRNEPRYQAVLRRVNPPGVR